MKENYRDIKVKELIAIPEIQEIVKRHVEIPHTVLVKKVRSPYVDKKNEITTQKIEAVSGTSILDVVTVDLTLVDCTIDAEKSINRLYHIDEYTLALDANMSGGKFTGYSPVGMKLLVTKFEEVQTDEKAKS